ncbi:MAG: DUF1778 domain-containing protein [Planctomycetaceae bacterium]
MATLTRTTDEKARVSLPKGFAATKVVIEEVGDSELRIRKARVKTKVAKVNDPFVEESERQLSPAATKKLIELLENPPPPTPALKRAIKEYKQLRSSLRRPRRG